MISAAPQDSWPWVRCYIHLPGKRDEWRQPLKLCFITHPAPWWWGTNTGHRGTSDSVPAFSLFTQLCIKPYIFIVRASKLYKETLEYHYYTKRSFLLIGTPVSLAALSQGITRSRWSHNTRNTMPARQNPELWQIKIVKNLWHEAY